MLGEFQVVTSAGAWPGAQSEHSRVTVPRPMAPCPSGRLPAPPARAGGAELVTSVAGRRPEWGPGCKSGWPRRSSGARDPAPPGSWEKCHRVARFRVLLSRRGDPFRGPRVFAKLTYVIATGLRLMTDSHSL